jgi:hypothetical protein
MKDQFLKLAGVKSDKEFYKLFPDEKSFMAKYGKQVKKLQMGSSIPNTKLPQIGQYTGGEQSAYKNLNYGDIYDNVDYSVTGSNQQMRMEQANLAAQQEIAQNSNKKGGLFDMLGQFAGGLDMLSGDGAEGGGLEAMSDAMPTGRRGLNIPRAQNGFMQGFQNFGTKVDAFGKKVGQGYDKVDAGLEGIGGVAGGIGIAGDLMEGFQTLKAEKAKRLGAQQSSELSDVTRQASQLLPEQTQRNYSRPEDYINYSNQQLGVGTNILTAKNGSEIKKAMFGMDKMAGQAGGALGSLIGGGKGQATGAGMIGSTIGGTVGKLIPVPGADIALSAVGGIVGGVIGGKKAAQTAGYLANAERNLTGQAFEQGARGAIGQYSGFAEYGASVPNMDNFRIGGNMRQEDMAMGGNLKTHWGGYAEPMSMNPYLPNSGETVMFRGKSHEESDGKGNTGIGITYGDNPVEVERGEPAIQLKDGSSGSNSLTVYGNLKIPNYGVEMLGDSKAKGKKFKNYVSDLTRIENSQNKIMEKSTKGIDSVSEFDPYDKLSFASYKSNMLGANMKLKDIADKKIKAANLQSAINDTAEEYGLIADDLAKGKVKVDKKAKAEQARFGKNILKAQNGVDEFVVPDDFEVPDDFSIDMPTFEIDEQAGLREALESYKNKEFVNNYPEIVKRDKDGLMTAFNQLLPYLRPSNAEPLDPNQLAGENFALASNEVEGVPVQTFQPELAQATNFSFQDRINSVINQTKAYERMAQNNPAALSIINAQAYDAINSIKADEFRTNQSMLQGVLAENRQALNQARQQNMGAYDQQFERQLGARTLTKAVKQAALNSISSKYAQNDLENRKLQTYENMYNYRFGPGMRTMNMNPLQQFNTDMVASLSTDELEKLVKERKAQEKEKDTSARNGAILKAFRS